MQEQLDEPLAEPMAEQLSELRALAAGAENRRTETGIPRVAMVQGRVPEHELAAVYEPMVNLILRGSKTMTIGDRRLHYDPATYFVMSLELPAVGTVHPEPSGAPYLAVSLSLEPPRLAALLADLPAADLAGAPRSGFSVARMTPALMDAWLRLMRLMREPAAIPALAPVYEREILYRVLQGPQGELLRAIALPDSALARVQRAIQRIRHEFDRPLRVEDLATQAAMSVSAFHRHFKAATALSPLQYQKRIRLLRARALILAGRHSVTAAAYEVGYESPNQFSREYGRAFGLPPLRDAARILGATRQGSGLQTQ